MEHCKNANGVQISPFPDQCVSVLPTETDRFLLALLIGRKRHFFLSFQMTIVKCQDTGTHASFIRLSAAKRLISYCYHHKPYSKFGQLHLFRHAQKKITRLRALPKVMCCYFDDVIRPVIVFTVGSTLMYQLF